MPRAQDDQTVTQSLAENRTRRTNQLTAVIHDAIAADTAEAKRAIISRLFPSHPTYSTLALGSLVNIRSDADSPAALACGCSACSALTDWLLLVLESQGALATPHILNIYLCTALNLLAH